MILLLLFTLGDTAVSVPVQPGLEFTLPDSEIHYTLSSSRLHFTLPDSQLHYKLREED